MKKNIYNLSVNPLHKHLKHILKQTLWRKQCIFQL